MFQETHYYSVRTYRICMFSLLTVRDGFVPPNISLSSVLGLKVLTSGNGHDSTW